MIPEEIEDLFVGVDEQLIANLDAVLIRVVFETADSEDVVVN